MNRRFFIQLGGAGFLGSLIRGSRSPAALATPAAPLTPRDYQGSDFTGWQVVVGDGIYAAPGEPPVNANDIETIHYGSYSELRANILMRRIMAHNITYKSIVDETAFDYIHRCGYHFRLPYLPAMGNTELNAQTVEGGLFIWDGGDTRLDYGLAFQWILNPWMESFGAIQCWTDVNDGQWMPVGYLEPDMNWHEVVFVFDFRRQTTALVIDGNHYPARFTATPKPEDWGTETAARLQAEIISIYPGEQGEGRLHKTQFQNWFWNWEPYNTCAIYLPMVAR